MNDAEYKDLQRRIDADCDRVAKEYARTREKRKATKKPRKQTIKSYMESESCGVIKDGAQ